MKQLLCIFLFTNTAIVVQAQSARDSVIATVNHVFEAMKNGDTALLKNCFADNALMQTIKVDYGVIKVIAENIADFIVFVGKETPGAADEQIEVESVKIDGPMAMVWTPYQFYYRGTFSHCGVNSFQLVRLSAGWKIQYLIDTRRKEGCR